MTALNRDHETLRMAVDLVILTVRADELQVLLIMRGKAPHRGKPALPGGFLRRGEDVGDAAVRELREETNLDNERLHLEQLGVYGKPDRDPRGRVISAAYLAIAPSLPVPVAGSDAREAHWTPVAKAASPASDLAFDHNHILADALEHARRKLEYSTLATAFCGDEFTIGDLRRIYEIVWGMPLDHRNFSRKVTKTEGMLVPTSKMRSMATGRPAALYRAGPARVLYPPMLRS